MAEKKDELDIVGLKLALGQICIRIGLLCNSLQEVGFALQDIYQKIPVDLEKEGVEDGHTD